MARNRRIYDRCAKNALGNYASVTLSSRAEAIFQISKSRPAAQDDKEHDINLGRS